MSISDATWVAGILALCGPAIGGAQLAEDVEKSFVAAYSHASGADSSLRMVPSSLTIDALTGAVDLAATLALGKPVQAAGLLRPNARLMIRRAERLDIACASLMAQALDLGDLMLIAVTDLHDPDAALATKLEARLPFRVESEAEPMWSPQQIVQSRKLLVTTRIEPKCFNDLCAVALSIGIDSPRAVSQAISVARAVAVLQGRHSADEECVATAARLVLAHRAQHLPPQDQAEEQDEQSNATPPPDTDDTLNNTRPNAGDAEIILETIKAALPAHLLQMVGDSAGKRGAGRNAKNNAPRKTAGQRGRRIGNRRSSSLVGLRLDIIATLRTAAPWQPLRRKFGLDRMIVTRDDFRVSRIKQRNEATAIFAVDASGSTAFQRLAEAKGAVETILAECYVRRDRVALVAFRGKKADLLLPPTRSLERAKRALAGLPGGGGTPLASGLDEVFGLAVKVRRAGGTPLIILLTDGRGNITRDGEGNKAKAFEESQSAARLFAAEGFEAMLIDVSPEPQKAARALASAMQARYLPMPQARATDIANPVRQALMAATSSVR